MKYAPQVMLNYNSEPHIVFMKGRKHYYAVLASNTIRLATLLNLRDLRPAMLHGGAYPVRKAASFYLNHSFRAITPRAKVILRGLVARKPRTVQP